MKRLFKFIIRLLSKENIKHRYVLPFVRAISLGEKEHALSMALTLTNATGVVGDYFEFGVFQGRSFHMAYNLHKYMRRPLPMHFYAFDSFEGLPNKEGVFSRGQYKCTEKDFVKKIKSHGVDMNDVTIISGWYKDTLNSKTNLNTVLSTIDSDKVSVALFDCDLYESTILALNFLTKFIVDGTVIIFDDWYTGKSNQGEQKAFKEWRKNNPDIEVVEWHKVGAMQMFILHI